MKKTILQIIFVFVFFTSCTSRTIIQRLQELEEGVSRPNTEAELREAIKKYSRRIEDIIVAEERIGIWYKILGTRYMDKKMYKKALECFQKALEIYPENPNLFYRSGIAAGQCAKDSLDFDLNGNDSLKQKYFELAVSCHKRAIEIEPNYYSAMYALSVLYVFELDEPAEAIPILEKLVENKKKPLDELFLLGRAYYVTGNSERAIECYKRIIDTSGSAVHRKRAKENMDLISRNILQSFN